MAEASVASSLTILTQLLVHESDLLVGVRDKFESLYAELGFMRTFLRNSAKKADDNVTMKDFLIRVRDVAYEVEDVIDEFVYEANNRRARWGVLLRYLLNIFYYPAKLRGVRVRIESIMSKLTRIRNDMNFFRVVEVGEPSSRNSSKKKAPVVEQDVVVGFDSDAEVLVDRLVGGTEKLEVISVVGMSGLGKTTLAKKVFTHPSIKDQFSIRAWVYVSPEYSITELFLKILESVTKLSQEIYNLNEDELAQFLFERLLGERFLIVMDDVSSLEAWSGLKFAFPNNYNGSRILLTSRNSDVALHANPEHPPHHLRFLSMEESWLLFCQKVFHQPNDCPPELERLGREIVMKCGGLPLAIVAIAGTLMKKDERHWVKVAKNVSSHLVADPNPFMKVLALSYKDLPFHLRTCFLYFGAFPEDFEIPVWKLLRLWVAEGFIEERQVQTLEDTAEQYLEELVNRNLISVTRTYDGQLKACHMHVLLHELCLREAAEERFLWAIKDIADVPSFSSTLAAYYNRRISIHSGVSEYISLKPSEPHVHSFLCFASEEMDLRKEQISFIPEGFKLLRVLDTEPINFPRFPLKIVKLVHLRYVALSGHFKYLPPSISNLWNLQTLIVVTTSRNIDIPADIWKLLEFRHLHTSGSARLSKPNSKAQKDNFVRRNIQTMSMVSPDSCTENILARTPKLKKLGIRGKLLTLVEEKEGSSLFDNLAQLNYLETLKLLNDTLPHPPSESKLPSLPQWYKFPPNLRKLTLSDTLLDWKHMSILGMLANLEVLKLKNNAFKGQQWQPLEGGFFRLRVLQLGKCDLVHWQTSSHQFPMLQCLVLKHCESLEAIPSDLVDIPTLQNIELYHTSLSAVASARKIQQEVQSMGGKGPKLHIYPPDM